MYFNLKVPVFLFMNDFFFFWFCTKYSVFCFTFSFDYGEKFWIIKCKKFTCACEEENCRYSSTTIHETLEKYKEKVKLEESM